MTDAPADSFGHSSEFNAAVVAIAATSGAGPNSTYSDGLANTGENHLVITLLPALYYLVV